MKKFLIILSILVLLASAYFYLKKDESVVSSYEPYTVSKGNISVMVNATGVVEPENRLEIKAPIAGRMENILAVEGQLVKKGEVLAWMSSTERAALLDAASAGGEKELKKWEELYKATPIMAPINGTIIQRNIEPGQTFTNSDSIFAMSDRLAITVNVDETDIAQVKLSGPAKITLDAYPDKRIMGKVSHIAYEAQTVSNVTTYKVKIIPDKIPDFLRSGMTVNVYFLVEDKKDILVIPSQALTGSEVLLEDNTMKKLNLGIEDGNLVEVIDGLNEGDVILLKSMKVSKSNESFKHSMPGMQGNGPSRRMQR